MRNLINNMKAVNCCLKSRKKLKCQLANKNMRIVFLFVFSALSFNELNAQRFDFGESAERIAVLIEYGAGYGYSYDVQYYNGEIKDVVKCVANQFNSRLGKYASACVHYIMEQGKLAYILTQYSDASVKELVIMEDKFLGNRKINGLYFDEDYEYYEKVYLAKNGYATIEQRKVNVDELSTDMKMKIINNRKKNEKERKLEEKRRQLEEEQQQIVKEKEEQKRLEITSKVYDLNLYDEAAYNLLVNNVKEKIEHFFETSEKRDYFGDESIPTFKELTNSNKRNYRYTNTFNTYYIFENNIDAKEIVNIQGEDKNAFIFNYIQIEIPKIKIEGYNVMAEARLDSINIDFAKGVTIVKIKKGNIQFLKYIPDEDMKEKIVNKIKYLENGKYILKYQYSNIMGDENLIVESEKRRTNNKFWYLLGGIALLGLCAL